MADPVKKPLFGAGDVTDVPGIPGFESRPGKKPNTGELFELEAEDKLYGLDNVTGKKQFPLFPLTKEFKQEKARSTKGLWNMAPATPPGLFLDFLRQITITPAVETAKLLDFNFTPDQLNKLTQASPQMGSMPSPYQQNFFTNIVQNPTTPYDEFAEAGLYEMNSTGLNERLYKERIDELEKQRGRPLSYWQKIDLYKDEFMGAATSAGAEVLAITMELAIPATATEKLIGTGAIGLVKIAGRPAANIVKKGTKKIIEGWGEVVDNVTLKNVQEVHAATTPLKDLTDDELWKVGKNYSLIDEVLTEQLDYLARGADGDSIHTSALEDLVGKPRVEWGATDINDLQKMVDEVRTRERANYEEVIGEAFNRDRLSETTVLGAGTGKPLNGLFFTGSGRQTVQEVTDRGAELTSILGDAVYGKTTKASAGRSGPDIDVVDVHINNPLVITGDRHWDELTKQANIENYMPNNIQEVEQLRRFISDSGYDGVVIRPQNAEDSVRLISMFGDNTVVKIGEAAKNPAKFNEILSNIPQEGGIGLGRLLKLVEADTQIARDELVKMVQEAIDSGEIVKNADGTYRKADVGTIRPEAEIIPSRDPIEGNPSGVPAEIARAADEHPVNRTGATEPTYTTKKTTEEPDPNRMNPPPNYDEPITEMWHTQGPRETMAERYNRFVIHLNELVNDTYWGVRHLQTLLEKAKSAGPTKERTNLINQHKKTRLALESPKLAEKDRAALSRKLDSLSKQIDDTAPQPGMSVEEIQRDLNFIREVTLAPGAVNVGITRAQMVIQDILKTSKNIMPDDLNTLLFVRRAKELLDMDPTTVLPMGKTYAELEQQLESMMARLTQKERTDLIEASDRVIKFYADERDRLVGKGIISKSLGDYFAKNHPHYNPMRYVQSGMQDPTWKAGGYKPFTNRNNTLIKQSEADLKDWVPAKPLDLIFETAIRNEAIGTRNELARIMVKIQQEWEKLPGVEKVTKRVGIGKGDNVIEFFENGRHYRYEVPAWMKREADYMTSTFAGKADWLAGLINGVSRSAFTSLSPVFIPVNAMADGLTALSTQGLLPHRTLLELLRPLKRLKEDNVALSHKLTGAYQARFFGSTGKSLAEGMGINTQMSEEQIAKSLEKKIAGKWLYEGKPIGQKSMLKMLNNVVRSGFGLGVIGEATEQAPRRAVFKRDLDKALGKGWEKKWTPEEIAQMPVARAAGANSVEVTLNFARGGLIAKLINPWLIFFNAGMEGFKLPYRVLRDNPKARTTLVGMIGGQTALTAYNMQYDEYYDVPSEKRWGGGIFMLPPNKKKPNGAWEAHYIEIVPYRQLSLFLGGATFLMEKWHQESPEAWTDFLIATGQNSMPLLDIPSPPLIEELNEQRGNKDYFRQQPIIPPEIADEPRAKQVMPWTSRTMKEIGESIDVSPERLDHAGKGIGGGLFSFATSITDAIIGLIDPEKVTPETARIFAEYEAIDDHQKKKDYYAKLTPQQRKTLDFELRKPEPYTRYPGIGPIADRFYSTGGGGIYQAAEKEAERVTGISGQDTRSIYAKMYQVNDEHLTKQQDLDRRLLSGEISGAQWKGGRSDLGLQYQAVLNQEAKNLPNSAQNADPKVRQQFYDTINKWTKNAPDDYNKTKMLSSAYYSITLNEPSIESIETGMGLSETLIPNPDDWEDFRMRQNEFLDSLSPEDLVLLENEITAGYTPIEKIYHEDKKQISSYYDYATAQLKTDLNKSQVLKKKDEFGIQNLSVAEILLLNDALETGLRDYENYKNGDPVTRKDKYKTGAMISQLLSDRLLTFRQDNYEMEKALYKWERITRPANRTLQAEYVDLANKLGGEVTIPLLIDQSIFYKQFGEPTAGSARPMP